MRTRSLEFIVGLFMIAGIVGLVILAFQVSGLTLIGNGDYYVVNAEFDNIGSLKVRAPVSVGGVTVGRITDISLDPTSFRAKVTMQIKDKFNRFPIDTSASILTEGLLGSNYISLTPGFEKKTLRQGDAIETTHSALILENLIGQLLFNMKGDKKE